MRFFGNRGSDGLKGRPDRVECEDRMNFKEEMEKRIREVNGILRQYLPGEEGPQKTVMAAMNYSIEAGGKRIRPMLMQETWKLFDGRGTIVEPFMAAQEMIHTYSLVHDDLPAMDNDEYRRGRKSTHAQYGEAMGILAGDALLNYAFETAASAVEQECTPRTTRALRILAEKAGIYGMIGGQVVDVESEGENISLETLLFLHRKKCGALIESAMMIGAILAGANDEETALIEQVGADVGIAFQIRDDILDVTSTTEVLGKPVGSDEKNQKVTYVSLAGMDAAKEKVKELSERAEKNLEGLGRGNPFLTELIRYLISRER